jgi:hypothetical protein
MKNLRIVLISVFVVFLLAGSLFGVQRYVPSQYPTIQDAINASSFDGDTIIVDDGVYSGLGNRAWGAYKLTIRSKNGPKHTIIDCRDKLIDESGGINLLESELDGFTITNGSFVPRYSYYSNIWLGESVLNNCIITNNESTWGGGVFCGEDSIISNCIIKNNVAKNSWNSDSQESLGGAGGGIACDSECTIVNCVITGNSALFGGGVSCDYSTAKIINCTIINNLANYGGGLHSESYSNATVTNSILADNFAPYGGNQICIGPASNEQNWNEGIESAVIVLYSNVQGGVDDIYVEPNSKISWGIGNIDQNVKFVNLIDGDYHLSATSPCRDAGFNVAISNFETDLDGNSRIVNGVVDMGAYEYQNPQSSESNASVLISNVNLTTNRSGQIKFTIQGTFNAEIENNDIHIEVGPFSETIQSDDPRLTYKNGIYKFKGTSAGITTTAIFNTKTGQFKIMGVVVTQGILSSPLSVSVEIGAIPS